MASRRVSNSAGRLAAKYIEAHAELTRAGRSLHDDVAPPLAGAGLLLSLIKTDFPETSASVDEAAAALEDAMEHIRTLSQDLNPSPADRIGLRNALFQFAAKDKRIKLLYKATLQPTRDVATALYELTVAAIQAASDAGATRIQIRVSGTAKIAIRISDNGAQRFNRTELFYIMEALAKKSGIVLQISTNQSTIVSLAYANRRATGR